MMKTIKETDKTDFPDFILKEFEKLGYSEKYINELVCDFDILYLLFDVLSDFKEFYDGILPWDLANYFIGLFEEYFDDKGFMFVPPHFSEIESISTDKEEFIIYFWYEITDAAWYDHYNSGTIIGRRINSSN